MGDALQVIVTEDDPDLRTALLELLESEGIAVACATTIEETRRELERAPDAVLLLDLNIRGSGWTGLDWLTDFTRRDDAPRTLLMSASVQGRVVAERFGLTFVAKPFDFDELLKKIRHVRGSPERPRDSVG